MAFPLISSGTFGYPKAEALAAATGAIGEWLTENDMNVSLVIFDKAAFSLSNKLLGEVKSFIDQNYVDEHELKHARSRFMSEWKTADTACDAALPTISFNQTAAPASAPLDKFAERLDEPFSATLLRLIDAKGKTDAEIYKRANIDRKLFSKIRIGKGYMPSKKTVVALAVALELSLSESIGAS